MPTTTATGGLLSIDRDLPFLLVYREPAERDDPGTARLVASEAAFLIASADGAEDALQEVRERAVKGAAVHGAFLLLEIWAAEDADSRTFTLRAPEGPAPETVGGLHAALASLTDLTDAVRVELEITDERAPAGLEPLLSVEESWQQGVLVLGLEVPPIYRDPATGELYPLFLRRLQQELSGAMRRGIYEFVRVQTSTKVENHLALGTRTPPSIAWEIDRALCELEDAFDMLLLVSPINQATAWKNFEASGFEQEPKFHYRLLPLDPDLLKRRLYAIQIERIDDPALADLFDDKRREIDIELTMLRERDSVNFRYGSYRLFGTVDDRLLRTARDILEAVPPPRAWRGELVDAAAFQQMALRELNQYREDYPGIRNTVELRRDITGLMVSDGNLLIGETLAVRPDRVMPLIHHEVGTHVLTFVNGSVQPLRQLAFGLAGYDEFQEGLAVLSEYLVGGLDRARLRLLAARVIAAHAVENGAGFVETFRLLTRDYGYSSRGAWHVAVRVHASGGFTRDLIYLRGLVDLIDLLRRGAEIEPLYIGKLARKHIPVLDELRHRGVLRSPPLLPRYLKDSSARERLEAVRQGLPLNQMISPDPQ